MLKNLTLLRQTGSLLRGLPVLLFLVLLLAGPAGAQAPGISPSVLREAGVRNFDDFWPVEVGPDGRTVYFWETLKPANRPVGTFANLWQFRFASDGSLAGSRCYPLKMPRPLQACLTPDGRGVVLMAREGASFWYMDLESGKLREFITPALGRTRFVSDPRVLWTLGGKLWAVGYTLDSKQVRGPHTVVELHPERTGEECLVPSGLDVDQVLAHFKPWKVQSWVSPELGWIGGMKDGALEMAVWQKSQGFTSLGRYRTLTSAWRNGTWQLFTAEALDGTSQAVVYDAATHQRWDLKPSEGSVYDYPFISEDGGTLVLVEGPRQGARMKVLYGHRSTGFKLQPLPGFESVQKGYVRLSKDGRVAVIRNQSGIFYVLVPRD